MAWVFTIQYTGDYYLLMESLSTNKCVSECFPFVNLNFSDLPICRPYMAIPRLIFFIIWSRWSNLRYIYLYD